MDIRIVYTNVDGVVDVAEVVGTSSTTEQCSRQQTSAVTYSRSMPNPLKTVGCITQSSTFHSQRLLLCNEEDNRLSKKLDELCKQERMLR